MASSLKIFGAFLSVFWMGIIGFGLGVKYETLPAGWPNYEVHWLFFHYTVHLPNSIGSQLAALKARDASAKSHVQHVEQAQAQISTAAGAHDAIAQTKIRVVTQTLYKEIPYAVTPSADAFLPFGWVRLHDAAALGDLSKTVGAAGQSDGSPSPVKDSAALGVIVENYGTCRATAQQLIDLQDLVRQQQAVK